MNIIMLMGRLTKDPDIRYTQSAAPVCVAGFSIAVDRRIKRDGEPDADFFNCTAFGKLGEFTEKYLKKGTKIIFRGHAQNNNYTNRNGERVYGIQMIADEIEFAESKNTSGNGTKPDTRSGTASADAGDGFMHIPEGVDDSEIPFR